MSKITGRSWGVIALAAAGAILLPGAAAAQTVSGQARAAQSVVSGPLGATVTTLADTGTLGNAADARQASASSGSVPALVTASTLHATTIGMTTAVDSEASLADLSVTVGGNTIGAGFVMSRAAAAQWSGGSGTATVTDFSINGVAMTVGGGANQTFTIPGGRIVVNEQQTSPTGVSVNALHITIDGVADVVIASASAGVQ